MKRGLINELDALIIEKTLTRVINEFQWTIKTTEIGIYNGDTSRGIHQFFIDNGRSHFHTAIDSQKDFKMESPFPECRFIIGNSSEVYNELQDNSQAFIFVDANHSFPSVIADFFCYADKVSPGGYMAFHDTGKHIKFMYDYQRVGSESDPDMYISVRRALKKIGLLDNKFPGWELIYDDADPNDEAGGIVVIQKSKL
jgi:hypothetical protein